MAACCFPHGFTNTVVNLLPCPVAAPRPEVMINSSPRRQIMRQQFPGTSTADCVEDAVQDFPSAVYGRASARLHHRDERFQVCPLGVGHVSVVRAPAGHRCSSAYGTEPFQTPSNGWEQLSHRPYGSS